MVVLLCQLTNLSQMKAAISQMRKVIQVMTDRFEYSSSSDNDESSDSYSAEEIKIPEGYEPEEGVESDDDRNECCHWDTQQTEHSRIRKRRGIPETG